MTQLIQNARVYIKLKCNFTEECEKSLISFETGLDSESGIKVPHL